MGDFILDFRGQERRCRDGSRLRFYEDQQVVSVPHDDFALYVGCDDRLDLWAPHIADDGLIVALAGRVALDDDGWKRARELPGDGGAACKLIGQIYREQRIDDLRRLGSGGAVLLWDPVIRTFHVFTDRAGAYPCYLANPPQGTIIASHPDVLAELAGVATEIDPDSLAEFVATGVVSFPHSYYRGISALEHASVHRLGIEGGERPVLTSSRLVSNEPDFDRDASEKQMSERLAAAMSSASRKRTLPQLGKTAIALSGGLDSRAILCAASRHEELVAFCLFDEENAEFRTARAIAEAARIELIPFKRSPDYYAENAQMGVRISGGMGELASNHFLGFRSKLREHGIENLVTGCYFDYLFKSLALDTREAKLSRREVPADFAFPSYLPHCPVASKYGPVVRGRLDSLYAARDRASAADDARARIAARRTFPLWHEGDNMQRLVPMRVMGWSPPALDDEVLDVCRSMPPSMKLNKSVFRRAVIEICGTAISRISDANTGLPLDAPSALVALKRYQTALRRSFERKRHSLFTQESWPNWTYYIRSSPQVRSLWQRPNAFAREMVGEISGQPFDTEVATYCEGQPTQYFMRLLTLKLWLDTRSSAQQSNMTGSAR